jgi:hypothetical protein
MENDSAKKSEGVKEHVSEGKKGSGNSFVGELRRNFWVISTVVLAVVVIVLLMMLVNKSAVPMTGDVISDRKAGELILDFASVQGIDAELVGVEKENGLYRVDLLIQDQEVPVYITINGENLVPSVMPLSLLMEQAQQMEGEPQTQEQPTQTEFSDDDLEKIEEFMNCLSDKGVKVYGANWCGYTKALIENLGGYEVASPIYVECTEDEELCSQEGIEGYPTIKINGEVQNIQRTLQGFADATGCSAPSVGTQVSTNTEVSC